MKMSELYSESGLPHINHEHCPVSEIHSQTIRDLSGRVRCAEVGHHRIKPSFMYSSSRFDKHAEMSRIVFGEGAPPGEPCDYYYDEELEEEVFYRDESEWEAYRKLKAEFDSEEPIDIMDACYAIISDADVVLPFETVLDRLNLAPKKKTVYCNNDFNGMIAGGFCRHEEGYCRGHTVPNMEVIFPFDGWDVAFYLQKWKDQQTESGEEPPWFADNL
jgi:hypothetical protein